MMALRLSATDAWAEPLSVMVELYSQLIRCLSVTRLTTSKCGFPIEVLGIKDRLTAPTIETSATARACKGALGLKVPLTLQVAADEVIE